MKKYLLLHFVFVLTFSCYAQTNSSGKCYNNDYNIWNTNGQPDLHGDCANNPLFNTGNEITLEVWVKAFTFGENRKIMGKLSPALNDGYVMGFQNLNIYTEISNPTSQQIPSSGTGPLPLDSAWVHLATTYSSTGQMINYMNGENVGEITIFPQNPISQGTTPFIIGRAPWDYAYLFYGSLDEIRVWNVAKTQTQLKEYLHKELKGNEPGLVANYSFNNSIDSVFYDKSPNNLNGIIKQYGHPCFSWKNSEAPVGDSLMYNMHEINGAWFGKSATQYSYALTNNGLSAIAKIQNKEFSKYVIFGHNDSAGTSITNIPVIAPSDFKRMNRVWYLNQGGNVVLNQLVFNLTEAAAGGTAIPSNRPDTLYSLLKWDNTSEKFIPIYCASIVYNNSIIFNNIQLTDGYYTLGHGSTRLAGHTSDISNNEILNNIKIYPVPADNYINIDNAENTQIIIYDSYGKLVKNTNCNSNNITIDIMELRSGLHIVNVIYKDSIKTQKILIK
jgi:hypothetical protein